MSNSITGTLTGGLLDPGGGDYSGRAAKAEKRRKTLITQGMDNINAVFGGGTTSMYTPVMDEFAKPEWKSYYQGGEGPTYYTIGKNGKFKEYVAPKSGDSGPSALQKAVMGLSLAGGGPPIFAGMFGGDASPRELANRRIKQGNLFLKEDKTFKGFGDDFFNEASDAYTNFAMPDLNRQYKDTHDNITFGLANRGLLNSSVSEKAMSDLNISAGQKRLQVADNARATAQNLRKQIEQARQDAIAQLYQTADPAQGLKGAIATASQFTVPQAFTPIMNAFGDVANRYAARQLYNNYVPPMYASQFDGGINLDALSDIE